MRLGNKGTPPARLEAIRPVRAGDYFCSERDLYRVEQLVRDHALLEDCRSGDLIDMPVSQLADLQRVETG